VLSANLVTPEKVRKQFSQALTGDGFTILRVSATTDANSEFATAVAAGLQEKPPSIPCRFLYDARGSELYEMICVQPEYYLTRTEESILANRSRLIREITGAVTLFELGSGSSTKTRHLLEAYGARKAARYIPVDVSGSALRQAGQKISRRFPQVRIIGIQGSYEDAFPLFGGASPAMVIFLGSTVGNLDKEEAGRFFRRLAACLGNGDYLLLGADLVKDPALLEAAYNDAAGVTEAFTRNLFLRMNRELGCTLDISTIHHEAHYNAVHRQIEIYARFAKGASIRPLPLDVTFHIDAGERIQVEISRKFQLEELPPWLASFGFQTRKIFTDERGWFALLLLQKA
jgi:L-histidine Nalpha-methyltransferase